MFVVDASTLILLAKATALRKLAEEKELVITEKVREEVVESDTFDAKLIQKLIREELIEVEEVHTDQDLIEEFRLDEGEASTYELYDDHALIATDDKQLIKLCRLEEIPFASSMPLLVRMYEKDLLGKAETLSKLERLNEQGWYSENFYERMKEEVKDDEDDVDSDES